MINIVRIPIQALLFNFRVFLPSIDMVDFLSQIINKHFHILEAKI